MPWDRVAWRTDWVTLTCDRAECKPTSTNCMWASVPLTSESLSLTSQQTECPLGLCVPLRQHVVFWGLHLWCALSTTPHEFVFEVSVRQRYLMRRNLKWYRTADPSVGLSLLPSEINGGSMLNADFLGAVFESIFRRFLPSVTVRHIFSEWTTSCSEVVFVEILMLIVNNNLGAFLKIYNFRRKT